MIKTAGHGIKCRSAHPLKPEFSQAGANDFNFKRTKKENGACGNAESAINYNNSLQKRRLYSVLDSSLISGRVCFFET